MKKVLVFGIGGFVGKYLADEFLDNGYEVIGSDIKNSILLPSKVKFYKCDLMNTNDVLEIMHKIKPNMIVNLAAISSVGNSWDDPQMTIMANVVGAINILEAARKLDKMPKVMLIGSSEEYVPSNKPINEKTKLNANNPYGISKETQEKFVKLYREQYRMKIYYVRPFNHTGIGQKDSFVLPSFCKQVAEIEKSGKSGIVRVGNLKIKRDFSHVKDIVRAYRMIIESDNYSKVYNVGSGIAYELDEMLQYVVSLSNQDITVEIDSTRVRPIDTPIICCDRSLIKKEIGWEPKYTVFDALKEMVEDYLK